jgi:hypothetical protein
MPDMMGLGLAGTWNVGCPARFIINARDEYSNKLRKGGAEFAVRVMTFSRTGQALPESRGRVSDLHDGSYECVYTPEHIGMVTLTVNCKDHDAAGNVRYVSVKHSPFEVTVQPDFMSAHMSTASGAGCEGQLVAGEPTEFDLYAKDKFGNRLILVPPDHLLTWIPRLGLACLGALPHSSPSAPPDLLFGVSSSARRVPVCVQQIDYSL